MEKHRPYVVVDLDGTLTIDEPGVAYPDKALDDRVAAAARAARAAGYGVMVLTARGMRTWKNDRALVEQHVRPGVLKWLEAKGVDADEVHVAKPWCGPGGFYVDDRNLHVEEFVFRFGGPLAGKPVAARIEGREPSAAELARLARIERWMDVCAWSGLGERDRDDGRTPAADLVVTVGTAVPNVAGWFALHGEEVERLPIEVRCGDGGWRLQLR